MRFSHISQIITCIKAALYSSMGVWEKSLLGPKYRLKCKYRPTNVSTCLEWYLLIDRMFRNWIWKPFWKCISLQPTPHTLNMDTVAESLLGPKYRLKCKYRPKIWTNLFSVILCTRKSIKKWDFHTFLKSSHVSKQHYTLVWAYERNPSWAPNTG